MSSNISYIGSAVTEEKLFMMILDFAMYYAILFLEAYIALWLFWRSTDKNLLKNVSFIKDKNQFSKAYKNIILSYIAGFASIPLYVIVTDIANKRNILVSLLSIPSTFIFFPFYDRNFPNNLICYVVNNSFFYYRGVN